MAVTSIYPTITPPIVPDMEPAFVRTTVCKVYFSFSSYNSTSDIKNIQVSVTNQKTNISALDPVKYPTGIKIVSGWSQDGDIYINEINNDYQYYINLYPEDLTDSIFGLNQVYKVQLRFTHIDAEDPPAEGATSKWINDNLNYFSEWSKVCLIKGIEQPYIKINTLEQTGTTTFFIPPTEFVGRLYYIQNANIEKQTLKSYNINIYTTSGQKSVMKTEQIYTNQFNPNEFYYQLLYDLEKQINYTLAFNYTTTNLYKSTANFQFIIAKEASNKLNATITATPEENNGSIKLDINFGLLLTSTDLIIKRASAKTNFLQWENLKTISHYHNLKHLWYDTSIESGVWYKYRIQQVGENGRISEISQPVMCLFEDAFLTQGNKQLKIQFNPSVSDFKYNVAESQQVTLGSQYPYIKRNGNNYYRTFSLSGLISALMDEIRWYDPGHLDGQFYDKNSIQPFTTPNELFGDAATALYNEYNQTNDISYYEDYIYEREFRQKVMQFLYKNNIKLFRSLTEGNILVKLTNIAFQPIDTLGRRLYSFSATAIEVNNNILENLKANNLINNLYYTYAQYIIEDIFESGESLIDRFYTELNKQKNTINVMELTIDNKLPQDAIVYAKPINNKNLLRYIAPREENHLLQIYYSDADPIAQSYFYGLHFNEDELIRQEGHYENPQDVENPINYGVYSIVDHYFIRIDRYIEYFRESDLLSTYHDEVLQNSIDNKDYDLLVESMQPVYFNMIYYDGQWYPLLDNNDIIIKDFPAKITFTYRIKKED